MHDYSLSDKRAKVLDTLVREGIFKNPQTALNYAVDNYLSQKRPVNFTIDSQAADDNADRTQKTQDQWIDFFNKQSKGMISAPNLYEVGKSFFGTLLDSLQLDFDESWEVSSTRIIYSKDDLSGKIIHNYGGQVIKSTQVDLEMIPVYNGTPLADVLYSEDYSEDGVKYLQTLFATKNNPETIIHTIEHLSGRKAAEITIWTPDQGSRKSYSEVAVGFGGGGGGFHVGGGHLGGYGHSRGVSISPCSGR